MKIQTYLKQVKTVHMYEEIDFCAYTTVSTQITFCLKYLPWPLFVAGGLKAGKLVSWFGCELEVVVAVVDDVVISDVLDNVG